ncbi:MAG TPA: LysR family transcriptional regulator [Acidimicrobiales bacterium]|nr:LysR family transcriptional regulator [Acidimicrobiales bacterium]
MREATLKQLRSLVAVARTGTIAAGAQRLHVTAPAVGQQLKLLEQAVGMPVLVRSPDGFRPTDAGRELLAVADRIEAELEGCALTLDLIREGKVGSVTLGAVSTAKYFAPQLLAAFWDRHPDIEVTLVIGNRSEIVEAITAHEVDITVMGRPPAGLALETTEIGEHPHVVVAAPDHPRVGQRVTRRALGRETFLVREPGSGTRQLAERLFAGAEIAPRVGMEITSNETIKQAVIAGLGVALISAHTVAAEVHDGRLVCLDVDGFPVVRHWYGVRHAAGQHLPACEALWAFLGERGREHLPAVESR